MNKPKEMTVEFLIENSFYLSDGDIYGDCNNLPDMMNKYREIVRGNFGLEMPKGCYLDELVSLLACKLAERIKKKIIATTDIKVEDIEFILDESIWSDNNE